MPEVSLKLRPGVNAEFTPTLNESAVSSCQLIRFKAQLPQKLGGWSKYFPFSISGVPRDLHAWADLNGSSHLAVGTTTQLAVISSGALQDITPQQLLSNFAPNFSTTSGSPTVGINDPNIANVTIYDAVFFNTPISVGGLILEGAYQITNVTGTTTYQITAGSNATATVTGSGAVPVFTTSSGSQIVSVALNSHGLAAGNQFTFPIASIGGGVTILGTYTVVSVSSPNAFTISSSTQATSAATFSMNGGNAQILYYITLGPSAPGIGYGLGGYGLGGYGTGVIPSAQTGLPITATNWSQDNWGGTLLACPENGGIYEWAPDGGFQNAGLVPNAPIKNGGIFIAMPQQILVAWRSVVNGQQQDPLIVRWSDIEDYTEWTPTSLTQAGAQRIPTGSEIRGGLQGPQQALIWTDLDLYAMVYLGPPLVFGFNQVGAGCGLIGMHAATVLRGVVYWMSDGNFFALVGGGVKPIPCSVWDVVFQDLDGDNAWKCVAAANSAFDEVSFYYPSRSGGTGEVDAYAKLNVEEGTWDYGSLQRTAWIDQSVLGEPIGTTSNGILYQHETSPDADGQPLISWFETGYFVLNEGQDFSFVDWVFPDMKWGVFNGAQTASVQITINAVDYPNGQVRTYGPFTMTSAQQFINTRLRGRQLSIRFQSSDLGSFWRLGNMRIRISKMGRR